MSQSNDDRYDIRAVQHKRMAEQIQNIAASLTMVEASSNPRLPERHFREIFLPFFAGDETLMYPVTMENWIKVATNPFQAVDIVDANAKVLFTVPPVLDRNAVNPANQAQDGTNIASVVATATQYAHIHPMQGQHYLNAELTKRALIMKVPNNVRENIEIWNSIFTRYGRPPIMALEEQPTGSTGSAPQQDKGTPDYDLEPL